MSIFVFGSNQRGIHGAGAAKYARQHKGATMGLGEGRSGNSYALPTKVTPYVTMTLASIKQKVSAFLDYAALHPHLDFTITQVGCGRAGMTAGQIAPLFYYHSANCSFDSDWLKYLPQGTRHWGHM